MFGAEYPLCNRQRALKERPRASKIAAVPKQHGEVVKALRSIEMLGTPDILRNR
jgi:hypothetical protein